jgi:hypothetical protein
LLPVAPDGYSAESSVSARGGSTLGAPESPLAACSGSAGSARDSGALRPMPSVVTEPSNKRWIGSSRRRMRIAVRPLRNHVAERSNRRLVSSRSFGMARPWVALATGYLVFTGCDYTEYPIEATFCDDWCRVLRRTGCEQEPENCIRDCESSRASDRCSALQSSLLDCYASTAADRFECVGQGFQSTVRPRPEICTEQRQALIRCEVPRVMECVDACEALDASDPSRTDAGAMVTSSDCPEPPFPCERMCWELDARFGRGRPTTLSGLDATDDTNLAAIGEPYMRCAQARAAECRAGAGGGADAGAPQSTLPSGMSLGADASVVAGGEGEDTEGLPPGLATSWTGLFLDCAGLPLDFEIFFD